MTDIGMCFLLILLFLAQEGANKQEEEWLNTLKPFMEPTLQSVEEAFQEAETQRLVEHSQASLAISQLQLMRQALEASDGEGLKQILTTSFEQLGFSLEEVKHDIQRLSHFCAQLNKSFRNIFNRTAMTTTLHAA